MMPQMWRCPAFRPPARLACTPGSGPESWPPMHPRRCPPGGAINEARQVLALYTAPDLTIFCGRLLVAGMRGCADLAEQARARRDGHAASAAQAAADGLTFWGDQMAGAPFTD